MEELQDAALLAEKLKKYGVRLFDENGQIRDFMVVLDDLFLNTNSPQLDDLMIDIRIDADKIFGGMTDVRQR